MFAQARRLSDIRAKDAPAFRMKATFSFRGDELEPVVGTYTETWISDEQWRRETVVGGLHYVEVNHSGKTWLIYPEGFPARALTLSTMMELFPPEALKARFASIKQRVTSEVSANCAYSRPVIRSRQYAFCFEKQSGVLLEKVLPVKRPRNSTSLACEYGTFHRFGTYTFPREVVCYEDTHRVMDAKVAELELEPVIDPGQFDQPAGSIELDHCAGKSEPPSLSMNELMIPGLDPERATWVNVWFVVDAKGKAQNIRVQRSTGKVSHAKAIDALRSWRFSPGTCEGKPIATQMMMELPSTPK